MSQCILQETDVGFPCFSDKFQSIPLFILNAGHYCFSIFSHFQSINRLLKTKLDNVLELDNLERARSTFIELDDSFCPPGPRVYRARLLMEHSG